LKSFEGANGKRLNHFILPDLHEKQPDCIIIHGGTNDIDETTISSTPPIDFANNIIEIGKTCKKFGTKRIAFSSILPRKEIKQQKVINEVNDHLKNICAFNSFSYIDNSNINESHLHLDGTHLSSVGSHILSGNLISFINSNL